MKSIAAATLFASVAFAQSASLIPTGISSSCSTFLTSFNSDTSLSGCVSNIIAATGAFAPSTNASAAASSPSAAEVKTALASVCSTNSACQESTIRSKLADFYEACGDELATSSNKDVIRSYDVLYALTPARNAICSKGDDNDYCVFSVGKTVSPSLLSTVAKYISIPVNIASSALSRRADAQAVAAVAPNATTFAENNILFLGLTPDLPKDALCQTCTRNVITSFISFESNVPYAVGLSQSVLLSGQSGLYQGVQKVCGDSFLQGAVAAAAGLSGSVVGGSTDNGAMHAGLPNTGAAGLFIGALTVLLGAAL